MSTLSHENLIHQLQWRYAVKKFDATKKISASDWKTLEDALVLTPSSYGLQPWQFLVVQNPEMRGKLLGASWNQKQVVDCSHFVVFTAKTSLDEKYVDSFFEDASKTRGVPVESMAAYKQMMVGDLLKGLRSKIIPEWSIRQAYIALGNLMTCAAVLGIDTCPMEGIDPPKYDEILKVDPLYKTAVACAVGYRSPEDKYAGAKKVRFQKSQMIKVI